MILPPNPGTIEERLKHLPTLDSRAIKQELDELTLKSCSQYVNRRDPCTDDCSHCGACCVRVLPIERTHELPKIRQYLQQHPELKKYILKLNGNRASMLCPFLDYTQPDHKCLLYHSGVLPIICERYTCNPALRQKKIDSIVADKPGWCFQNVDVWYALFFKATRARDIAPAWSDMDLLHRFKFMVAPEVKMDPDKFIHFFEEFSWKDHLTHQMAQRLPPKIMNGTEADAREYLRNLPPLKGWNSL